MNKLYVQIENNEIIVNQRQLPKAWKNISGFNFLPDSELKKYGWVPYEVITVDIDTEIETYAPSIITIYDDRVVEQQQKRLKDEDELQREQDAKAESIRRQRDEKLSQTDWVVIKHLETPIINISEWHIYRQALRDITLQETFPESIDWPSKPE